jgi:hypothetical protein
VAEKSVAHRLLALFTSPEHADAIEGDLLEERQTHGRLWFAVNVVTTALALWKQAVELELLRTAALTALAVGLSCLACGLVELVRIELAAVGLSIPTLLLIAACAFLLGAGLVRVAPVIGASAAIAASLVLLLLFLYSQIDVRAEQVRDTADGNIVVAAVSALALLIRDLMAAALLYLLPLNLGSVLMHGRRARR